MGSARAGRIHASLRFHPPNFIIGETKG